MGECLEGAAGQARGGRAAFEHVGWRERTAGGRPGRSAGRRVGRGRERVPCSGVLMRATAVCGERRGCRLAGVQGAGRVGGACVEGAIEARGRWGPAEGVPARSRCRAQQARGGGARPGGPARGWSQLVFCGKGDREDRSSGLWARSGTPPAAHPGAQRARRLRGCPVLCRQSQWQRAPWPPMQTGTGCPQRSSAHVPAESTHGSQKHRCADSAASRSPGHLRIRPRGHSYRRSPAAGASLPATLSETMGRPHASSSRWRAPLARPLLLGSSVGTGSRRR